MMKAMPSLDRKSIVPLSFIEGRRVVRLKIEELKQGAIG